MSVNLKAVNIYPIIKNFTAVQTWTEVNLPSKGVILTIGCEQHDIYFSFTGTDGGGIAGVDKVFIKSGGYFAINMGKGTNQYSNVYIASKSSASAEVTVTIEE